jgi:hypothetical protein
VANELKSLRDTANDAKADREALAPFAKEALAGLPESVRKGILKRAGESPRAQLNALAELKEMGLLPSASTTTTARPAPATTSASPLQGPASAAGPSSDPDVAAFRKYEELLSRSQFRAAQFYNANGAAIRAGKTKSAAQ